MTFVNEAAAQSKNAKRQKKLYLLRSAIIFEDSKMPILKGATKNRKAILNSASGSLVVPEKGIRG